jgi:2-phospho-L-lactate/phosphoenolpyruvate guanylyltransferase
MLHAVIPFKPQNAKTRLSRVMSQGERERFARAMLQDVLDAVRGAGCEPTVLCTHPFCAPGNTPVIVNMAGLNEALNPLFQQSDTPVLVIMSDLPLATPEAVERLITSPADVALVPGRGGGTNAIFLRHPKMFRADFYGASYLKHAAIAEAAGCRVEAFDSFRLHTDIDEEDDLVELLIHGKGKGTELLLELGFSLSIEHGRVGVKRNPHE